MTKAETSKIMAILRVAYPGYYKDASDVDAEAAINLWHTVLGHQPYDLVKAAVHSCIAGNKWPPTIAEVNMEIARITQPDEMTEMEAWNLVTRALSNSGYESKKEFEALPGPIQRVLGSPTTLREWAMMPVSEIQTVVASNFQRSYRAIIESDRKNLVSPEIAKQMAAAGVIKSLVDGGGNQ